MTRVRTRISTFFKARSGAFKAAVGLVGPTTAIVSMLLALGLISPFGGEDAIAKSVNKTKDASTSEVAIGVRVLAPANGARPVYYKGEGEFDHETGYGHLFLDFSQTQGMERATNVETILRGPIVYFRRSPGSTGAAGRWVWLKVDLGEVADRLAKLQLLHRPGGATVDLAALSKVDFPDPSSALDFLKRSSDLEQAGERTVFGKHTRYFTGTLKQDQGTFRLAVWIDDDDLVRQIRIAGGTERLEYTLGFKGFDVNVDASPPQGAGVRDAVQLMDQADAG